jgi:hypothetical protein
LRDRRGARSLGAMSGTTTIAAQRSIVVACPIAITT